MSLLDKVLRRGREEGAGPKTIKLAATPGENPRAYARRVARAERSAPILVLEQPEPLPEDVEAKLRRQIAKVRGIEPDEVDLDEVVFRSGAEVRNARRRQTADQARKRKRAQRRFNRQNRAAEQRIETAEAMGRVAAEGSGAMAENVRRHLERQAPLNLKAQKTEAQRANRRAAHEERRAAKGQTPDGRPA